MKISSTDPTAPSGIVRKQIPAIAPTMVNKKEINPWAPGRFQKLAPSSFPILGSDSSIDSLIALFLEVELSVCIMLRTKGL